MSSEPIKTPSRYRLLVIAPRGAHHSRRCRGLRHYPEGPQRGASQAVDRRAGNPNGRARQRPAWCRREEADPARHYSALLQGCDLRAGQRLPQELAGVYWPHVKAGELLASIDTPDLDQQFAQAKADLATATTNAQLASVTAQRWNNLVKSQWV